MTYVIFNKYTNFAEEWQGSLKKFLEYKGLPSEDGNRRALANTYDRKSHYKGYRVIAKLDQTFDEIKATPEGVSWEKDIEEEETEEFTVGWGGKSYDEISKEYDNAVPDEQSECSNSVEQVEVKVYENVLVIPDLHLPFTEIGALKFVKEIYKKNSIDKVIFLGDILDKTADNYHEREMNAKSIQDELNEGIEMLQNWYNAFPVATVIMGNHDRMYTRKAKTGGIPSHWLRSINEVLRVRNWDFVPNFTYRDWFFTHGEQIMALTRARALGMSVAQGHRHSEMYLRIASINKNKVTWGLQLGALIDHTSFAFNYAKDGKPIAKGVAIIKNIGTLREKIEIIPFIKKGN